MPQRPFTRAQTYLLPPALDDWVPATHPVRFVAAWLDGLADDDWTALGIELTPAPQGEARYAPQALLAIWVYGFMSGIRSTRALETACRDQLPIRWLSGNQTPDHNTLWRFYQRHRPQFHHLFHRSVRLAVEADLVDWAIQAVDGTKLAANAAGDRMLDAAQLAVLAARVDAAIAELEAQQGDDASGPPDLPAELADLTALRARIAQATARLDEGRTKGNVTDPDAHQMTARGANRPAYNAQAVVAPVASDTAAGGRLIVALAVRTRADDHGVLPALIAQATARTGQAAAVTVADAGYYSGADLAACAALGATVVIPEPRQTRTGDPYGPDAFTDDPATDTLMCPEGHRLTRWGPPDPARDARYGAADTTCRACPAKPVCCPTTNRGRVIVRRPHAAVRDRHRTWMASEPATILGKRRKGLIEPVFGILKTRHGARQCLLRGLANVQAEWTLLATAFNLQTLWRAAQGVFGGPGQAGLAGGHPAPVEGRSG
jgi:transposase